MHCRWLLYWTSNNSYQSQAAACTMLGPVSTKLLRRRRRRRQRTRRRLNHFYVEPIECFHRDFASASKSASDTSDASARNYNLDAHVFRAIFRT